MTEAEMDVDAGEDVGSVAGTPSIVQVELELMRLTRQAQQQHGLRHGDYQRYRQYCSRHLRRLRTTLHLPMAVKNRFVGNSTGSKAITPQLVSRDARYLLLLVVAIERAWAYAMQLKRETDTQPRRRFHMLSRLRKAGVHADRLQILVERSPVDGRTRLEVQTYCLCMKGALAFERQHWQDAIEFYSAAKSILHKLADGFSADRELYQQRIDDLTPNLRYCAYNVGDVSAKDDLVQLQMSLRSLQASGGGGDTASMDAMALDLDQLVAESRRQQAARLAEVTWLGRVVPVRQEKVRACLLGMQETDAQLARSSSSAVSVAASTSATSAIAAASSTESVLALYGQYLKDCSEAIQLLQDELRADAAHHPDDEQSDDTTHLSSRSYLLCYLQFLRHTKVIERNLLLAEDMERQLEVEIEAKGSGTERTGVDKGPDLVRLLSAVLQNLEDVGKLAPCRSCRPHVAELLAMRAAFQAQRLLHMAQACFQSQRWVEAVAVLNKCRDQANEARRLANDLTEFNMFTAGRIRSAFEQLLGLGTSASAEFSGVPSLTQRAEALKCRCQVAKVTQVDAVQSGVAALQLKSAAKLGADTTPLIDRLDTFAVSNDADSAVKRTNLAPMPPDFHVVPCRPLFFDLAENHVRFPDISHRAAENKKKNWFGWLTGKR